ncbi:hypothetical protein ACFQRB_18520 [Halobaculum litoreum]|uniref:Response regulatory domain-containing protein n=1 Tax=Halobaculum litoreum TaxID=3031998 RepID=A0ABD5XW70_9EURY
MSDPPASLRVLHVDGDRSFSTALREALDAADGRFDAEWVPDPDAGIDTLAAEEFDGVVTAYGFEADTATRFLNRARAAGHELPFVVFHDDESGRAAVDAVAADGAVALPKGTDDRRVAVLAEAIREAVDEGSTAAEPGGRPGADRFAAAFEALPYPAAHVEIRAEANVVRG